MLKLGIMVSGGGTNLQAILDRIESGYLANCKVVAVVSSKPGVFALERANKQGIPTTCISKKNYSEPGEYDRALITFFESHDVELIVLAGFLSMLGEGFIEKYRNRILNIHPSLIPAFCGRGYYGIVPHQKALEYGVKVTGATVHFVEPEYDSGPIVLQKAVSVFEGDTAEILQQRVMEQAEWEILPEAIKLYSEGKLLVEGRKVIIKQGM